ncbi:MAG: tetratricopeptide repeat protein [Candidatus Gastranaerophilales bacterium]|nr:tetratricopeptide repeat protein [Candidatus Gastranaerophilales bacterium]
MAIEFKRSNKSLSDFSAKSNYDKPSMAYQLYVKADALRLANYYKEAVGRYLNSILIDRDNADAYYGLGICYKNLNKFQKAIEALEKARKIREMDFSICYELGVCYLLSGEICLAMQNLVKSLKLNPKNINAQIQLAIAHEISEENDMALMIYQKIIETSPKYIKAYNHKSALLMSMEEYYEASIVFNQVLKINPDYYRAYLGIGICFDKLGKLSDAVRYYRKFLNYKPNSHHAPVVRTRLSEIREKSKINLSPKMLELVREF